jgi:molybdopterin synthase catalytic subunit
MTSSTQVIAEPTSRYRVERMGASHVFDWFVADNRTGERITDLHAKAYAEFACDQLNNGLESPFPREGLEGRRERRRLQRSQLRRGAR